MANKKADEIKADVKAEKGESVNLADMKAQFEAMKAEMLAEAKAEAEKIIADAKASVSGELTEEQKKANEERKAYWDELVPVTLFKDNNKYKDDVFVSVNDETCQIQRGKTVMVKRKFAEVLDASMKQDLETSELIEQKSSEYVKASAKF